VKVACRIALTGNVGSDIAQDVPGAITTKNWQNPPDAPIDKHPYDGCLDYDVCKPECNVKAHKIAACTGAPDNTQSLAAVLAKAPPGFSKKRP
jgi:hypothetical protein